MAAAGEENFLASFLPYFPLILTVVGWYVANSASAKREIRKEKRAEVDAICKLLADILSKARSYYTKASQDPDALKIGRELVFDLHRVLQRVERLEVVCPKFEVSGTWSELHEATTGGGFESTSRQPVPHNDPIIMNIEHWTHKTMDQLEEGFFLTYN